MAHISSACLVFAALFVTGTLSRPGGTSEGQSTADPASSGDLPSVVTAAAGGIAYLPCRLPNIGDSRVEWRMKDNLTDGSYNLTRERFRPTVEIQSGERELEINPVQVNDSGIYVCSVSGTPNNRHVVHLSVIDDAGPIVETSSVVTAVVGSTAYLPCLVPNIGSSTVEWSRKGSTGDKSYQKTYHRIRPAIDPSSGHRAIVIRSVQLKDAGVYVCFVSGVTTNRHSVNFSVVGRFEAGIDEESSTDVALNEV